MKKLVFLASWIILNTSIACAQSTPKQMVQQFFETYESKGNATALEELYATNKWMDKAGDAILNLKNQMEGLTEDYIGKYYGYEMITEKWISDSYVLMSYLVKFDRQPLRYTFQFYKPDKEWKVHSFQFDGNLDSELEESAKLYFLNDGF
jgi:hypothetical protein